MVFEVRHFRNRPVAAKRGFVSRAVHTAARGPLCETDSHMSGAAFWGLGLRCAHLDCRAARCASGAAGRPAAEFETRLHFLTSEGGGPGFSLWRVLIQIQVAVEAAITPNPPQSRESGNGAGSVRPAKHAAATMQSKSMLLRRHRLRCGEGGHAAMLSAQA